MDIDRVLRNTPATLTVTFYGDSSPADADGAVTVTVFNAKGTQILSQNASHVGGAGTGQYSFNLAPQANLNKLTLRWAGTFAGDVVTIETYLEIVGGFYFTLYEARNYDNKIRTDLVKYPDALLADARSQVETEFERICRRAFVPRYAYDAVVGGNLYDIRLNNPDVLKILSLTVDGSDWSGKQMVTEGRTLSLVDGNVWTPPQYNKPNILIEYEHGQAMVPLDIKRAALKRMKSLVIGQSGAIDERATTMTIPDTGTFTLATPGRGPWFTGIPDIDVVLHDWQWAGGVAFG